MAPLSDEQLVKLLPALEDAARADPKTTPSRFVPPRVGVLEQAAAKRHQFIFGRRGVGKSTLLRKIEQDSEAFNASVLFIDVETLRERPYPDVLIELLIELLEALATALPLSRSRNLPANARRMVTQAKLRRLRRTLGHLLAAPQEARHTVKKLQRSNVGGGLGFEFRPLRRLRAGMHAMASRSQERTAEAEFTATKMQGLLAAAVQIRRVLEEAVSSSPEKPTLVVLDDFYHVRSDDQPHLLAYLHQVVKNLPIYLKICGVKYRIKPFIEGDPPTGLQLGQDASDLSLDITLEQFQAAQTFLEKVLDGVCESCGLGATTQDLATETGRTRLVLGSGGVARDYLDLVAKSLRRPCVPRSHSGLIPSPYWGCAQYLDSHRLQSRGGLRRVDRVGDSESPTVSGSDRKKEPRTEGKQASCLLLRVRQAWHAPELERRSGRP